MQKFCEIIEKEVKEIANIYKYIIRLEMTAEDNETFQLAVDCHIYGKKLCNNKTIFFKKDPIHESFLSKEYKDATEFSLRGVMEREDLKEYFKKSNCVICKGFLTGETVRDHDLTGKLRGAAHSQCNWPYQLPKFVPAIFHTLSGYDSYYTSPVLSWDALLKKTEIKLDLLSDLNMILFIEGGIRGGVSMISNRYGKANNKYMENYDPKEESKYVFRCKQLVWIGYESKATVQEL